jgi:hypothetical protein
MALAPPSAGACRTGRALLAVKLVAVHGAGREREPGQDAWMPPRLEEGLRDDRVPGDPWMVQG